MIGYTTIGSNELDRSKTFYDIVLVPPGRQTRLDHIAHSGLRGAGRRPDVHGLHPWT